MVCRRRRRCVRGRSRSGARANDIAKRGIARAKAAAVTIDPKAEPIMAAAPAGSCLNDPTQGTCDTPEAIVADGQLQADGSTGYSDLTEPAKATAASAAAAETAELAALPQCWVKATSLVRSTGWARAYGQNYCTSRVQWQELYVTLWMYWKSDSRWHQLDVGSDSGGGGQTLSAHAEDVCRDNATRAFLDEAEGYDEMDGTWYAGLNKLYENLACVV